MSSMAKKMRKRAIPASSAKRSNVIVKRVPRSEITLLNSSMKPIIEQNRRERIQSWEEMHDKYVGG